MTAAGLPHPLVPPGLVLPGVQNVAQVVVDIDSAVAAGDLARHLKGGVR